MPVFQMVLDDRTELRLLETRHAEELFELVDSCRPYLREWLPWVDATQRAGDIRVFIRSGLKQFADGNGFPSGIWHEDKLCGVIHHNRVPGPCSISTLGYWLDQKHQGKGLMTKAVKAITAYQFEELSLNRVEIRCAEHNQKSRAIPEQLGFKQEGQLRDAEWLNDRYVDHIVYGMLQKEWHPSNKT